MTINKRLLAVLVLIIAIWPGLVLAQSAAKTEPQQTAGASSESRQVAAADGAGMKTRMFQVKYRDPRMLADALSGLRSASSNSEVRPSQEFKTITVRDYPENLATIEEALQRLDVPAPPTPAIEFHIHILFADHNGGGQAADSYPAEIADAVKQLHGTLKYGSYKEIASDIQQATPSGGASVSNHGIVSGSGPEHTWYNYSMSDVNLERMTAENSIRIRDFQFTVDIPGGPSSAKQSVSFRSPISLREGEKAVVGTSTTAEGAVVVILVAKLIH